MLRLALAPGAPPGRDLPRLLYYDHLDHLDAATWLGFERALVVRDRRATYCCSCLSGQFRLT